MKIVSSILILPLILLAACSQPQEPGSESVDLFNGTDLEGWQNFGGGKFYVEDGAIVGEAAPDLPNSFLATTTMYEDFELEVEFKVDDPLNSGIQIRSNTYPEETTTLRWGGKLKEDGSKDVIDRVWEKDRFWGYQIEIDPSDRNWTGTLYEEGGRGFLHSPDDAKSPEGTFKADDWNHFRIVAKGDHFQVWLNGVQTVDVHDSLTPTGYIALQLHGIGKSKEKTGLKVRWRNITLK
tara:strand:+ start:6393 stop:7103 length:711 start_codon:yes stop_codon:yes gene_type:complete